MTPSYRALDPERVIDTIAALRQRIAERFPGAGLASVCAELHQIAKENSARAERISRRNMPLRLAIFLLLAVAVAALVWMANLILTVLLGAVAFFLFRIEERLKRTAALRALHELRSIVHVIDMHQLTKDPSLVVTVAGKTASSPLRVLSPFEVTRYLDYCSEMVSLTSKVAVLFAQSFPDGVVTEVVSDIERVAVGLSQKIWQKIMIVQSTMPATAGSRTPQPPQAAAPAGPAAPVAAAG